MLLRVAPHLPRVDPIPALVQAAVLAMVEVELLSIEAPRIDPDVHVRVAGVAVHERRRPRSVEPIFEPHPRAVLRQLRRHLLLVGEHRPVVRPRPAGVVSVPRDFHLLPGLRVAEELVPQLGVGARRLHLRRCVVQVGPFEAVGDRRLARDVARVRRARLRAADLELDGGAAAHGSLLLLS